MDSMSDSDGGRDVRRALSGLRTSPRKGLAQHFLVSQRVLNRIIQAAELTSDDVVIEIGPGLGVLTGEMACRVRKLIAVELDEQLARSLQDVFSKTANVRIVQADARLVDVDALLEGEGTYKVVANLPYYAANPIVRRFLACPPRPSLLVVTVQREVAQRMAARPGQMSLLSVATQLYARPRIVCYVPPGAFRPPPKVSSAVVRLDVRDKLAVDVVDTEAFFRVVRAGFSAPRKQLRNAIGKGLDVPVAEVEARLRDTGIDYKRRAETLTLDEWGILYRAFA